MLYAVCCVLYCRLQKYDFYNVIGRYDLFRRRQCKRQKVGINESKTNEITERTNSIVLKMNVMNGMAFITRAGEKTSEVGGGGYQGSRVTLSKNGKVTAFDHYFSKGPNITKLRIFSKKKFGPPGGATFQGSQGDHF